MPIPFSPPIEYFQQKAGVSPARPFSAPPPGGEDPGVFAGFIGSALSSFPELFGAPATPLAEKFRTEHPVAGFISSVAGASVPYFGAEALAQTATLAPRLGAAVESTLGRFGMTAAEHPIVAGVTRELIVNAPVEASRLAVGTALFPDNNDLFADVAFNYALTGGIGGLAGMFRIGGKALTKAGQVEGADLFLAPTHQLKMVLDEGATVGNVPKEEFIPQLRQQVFTETPGSAGASKKSLPYVLPLEGMSADDSKAVNSLFDIGRTMGETVEGVPAKPTGLIKQTLNEGKGANQLKTGEQDTLLKMLPDTFQTADDIAKNVQYPRRVIVADQAGARQMAGITSRPGWQKLSDRLSLVQERDGGFVFAYKLNEGTGRALGKGAGKTKAGAEYLIGKTLNPGLFDPKAKQLADLVTARWAKWAAPFGPARFDDPFNKSQDLFTRAMSVVDYHNFHKLPEQKWKENFMSKLGRTIAAEDGFLDTKLGFRKSESLQRFADWAYTTFKPTEFLQRQNPVYGRFFGLMRNAYRTGDEIVSGIIKGQQRLKPGTNLNQAIRGKGVKYESAFNGHDPISDIIFNQMTPDEVTLMRRLSGTDSLSDEGLTRLVGDGSLSQQGADAIKKLKAINNDFISQVIMPVFKEIGYDVKWLENHLGIPHIPRGDLFYTVTDAAGKPKHLAFGKNGAQALREAKVVQEEAKAAGKDWKIEEAKPRHIAVEAEDALEQLGQQIFTNIDKTPEEGELIFRAMRRLTNMKATSGKNPALPQSLGRLRERGRVSTSYTKQEMTPAEVVSGMEAHLKSLAHFAGMMSWKERYGSIAATMLQRQDPQLYQDLIRKGNQMLGIEGKFTNALNDMLRPALGTALGSKPATKIASAVNKYIASANLFWLNPTFAVLNLLTPLQTVAPWIAHMRLASEADLGKTMFMQLTPSLDRNGLPNGVAAFTDPMKILGESVKLISKPTAELKAMFEQAETDGVFHPQVFEEWLGRHSRASQTLGQAWKENSIPGFLQQVATYPADASEKFSRLTAFNAGYLVGKNYFNLEGDALYRFARRAVEVTQFNYAAIDRSRIFTGPVGSMFGLFKNWQLHFMGNMMQYAGLAIRGENFAPITWMTGSALALGGLGATPLLSVANGLASWHDKDQNAFLWTQRNFDEKTGDAIYFGLPAFLGVSLQASAAIPGTDVRNETSSLFSFAMWSRAKQLAKAVNDAEEVNTATGRNGFADSNVQDELWSAIMPRFMTKLFSVVEGDYVKSMTTGAPNVRNVSPVAKLLVASGMNPIEVEQYQVASRLMYKEQDAREKLVSGLGRGYADAVLNKDGEEAQRILHRAIAAGELDSVMRSAHTRMNREQSGDILSRYQEERQGVYRQALAPR